MKASRKECPYLPRLLSQDASDYKKTEGLGERQELWPCVNLEERYKIVQSISGIKILKTSHYRPTTLNRSLEINNSTR